MIKIQNTKQYDLEGQSMKQARNSNIEIRNKTSRYKIQDINKI